MVHILLMILKIIGILLLIILAIALALVLALLFVPLRFILTAVRITPALTLLRPVEEKFP